MEQLVEWFREEDADVLVRMTPQDFLGCVVACFRVKAAVFFGEIVDGHPIPEKACVQDIVQKMIQAPIATWDQVIVPELVRTFCAHERFVLAGVHIVQQYTQAIGSRCIPGAAKTANQLTASGIGKAVEPEIRLGIHASQPHSL